MNDIGAVHLALIRGRVEQWKETVVVYDTESYVRDDLAWMKRQEYYTKIYEDL